jgi:5-methyltetrahydropteroyltriglutamate--homocysteine methyltransferase
MADGLPLLPTTVIGSHAIPSWMWTALKAADSGDYGPTDTSETFDDAVKLAILDQTEAGVDVITDGEMRRWYFVQGFYGRMEGLESVGVLRKQGVYGYDSAPRYRPIERIRVPQGLGIVEEFRFLQQQIARQAPGQRIKATCPGPLTLTIHIQLRDEHRHLYADRLALAWEFAPIINRELKALVAAGADLIQIDEPSFAIIPGTQQNWIDLFNACVEGVDATIALHVCFGNLGSRPRGKRDYGWMFPDLLAARCDQFVFEFANREQHEANIYQFADIDRDFGVGVVDVKSFWVEPPEEIAARIRHFLQYVPAERLWITPDCGFFQLPRWLCAQKLKNMVEGTRIVRRELTGT